MEKKELIAYIEGSKNIQDWNLRRKEIINKMNIKNGTMIDTNNSDFYWFMQNIDCNGRCYRTLKKNDPNFDKPIMIAQNNIH